MGKGKSGGKVKGGERLPLSVYEKRGFDVEAIRQSCKDIKEHEVFGKTYKVSKAVRKEVSETIEKLVSKTIEQLVRNEVGDAWYDHHSR